MIKKEDIQVRFVELLVLITKSGQAEWARSQSELGLVYCLTPSELIIFEVRAGKDLADPVQKIAGIVSKSRNIAYLFLEPTPGFNVILDLIRKSTTNEQRYNQIRTKAHQLPVLALEALIKLEAL